MRCCEESLRLDPNLAPSAVNLGLLLGRLGRGEEGVALLTGVLARHPRAVNALRNRAVLRTGLGDADGMAEDLRAAHALSPSAELAAALASYHEKKGDAARELDPVRYP